MKKYLLIFLAMLLSMAIVYAPPSVTLTKPANNDNINGTYVFNATVTYTSNWNYTNCTFATTADGIFGTDIASNNTYYNDTHETSSLTETASTTVTVTCHLANTSTVSDTSTGVTIDNTAPTCDCSLESREYISIGEFIEYDCTDSSDTSTLSYYCVTVYADASTETETGSTGTFEDTYVLEDATLLCSVVDEVTKFNNCSSQTIRIESEDGDGFPDEEEIEEEEEKNMILVIFLILVVLTGAISIGVFTTKKKR